MNNTAVSIELDYCVLCGEATQYPKSLPVDLRENYIEGAGQLCNKCGGKTEKTLQNAKENL